MSELDRVRDQLRRAYEGEAWHGPDLRSIVADLDAADAFARPIENAHSIAELVRHVIAWEREAAARLAGHGRELPPEDDWPEGGETPEAWRTLVESLEAAHRELMEAMAGLDDAELSNVVPGSPNTVYHLLHGVVQHNLYHAGQMMMLRRALRTDEA